MAKVSAGELLGGFRAEWGGSVSFGHGGARLGDVGKKLVNEGVILLLDDAALEFHSEGESATGEGEIVGEQGETLDGFVLSELAGETLDFTLDQSISAGMSSDFRMRRKLQAFLGEL